MSNHWEADRMAQGWRKVATGTWYYDGTVPRPIAIWAKPASQSGTRYDEDDNLVESRPIPETKDGFLYCSVPGAGAAEFRTVEEAKAKVEAEPWGPVTWD
jgi:hypothetical protein